MGATGLLTSVQLVTPPNIIRRDVHFSFLQFSILLPTIIFDQSYIIQVVGIGIQPQRLIDWRQIGVGITCESKRSTFGG